MTVTVAGGECYKHSVYHSRRLTALEIRILRSCECQGILVNILTIPVLIFIIAHHIYLHLSATAVNLVVTVELTEYPFDPTDDVRSPLSLVGCGADAGEAVYLGVGVADQSAEN